MNETLMLLLAGGAGLGLGAFFFGGLHWTVRRGLASSRPARWFLISLVLRSGVTLGGFTQVAGDDWQRWLACLLGFVMARWLVTRLTRLPADTDSHQAEVRHAPEP